jgi:hypothetical protein
MAFENQAGIGQNNNVSVNDNSALFGKMGSE